MLILLGHTDTVTRLRKAAESERFALRNHFRKHDFFSDKNKLSALLLHHLRVHVEHEKRLKEEDIKPLCHGWLSPHSARQCLQSDVTKLCAGCPAFQQVNTQHCDTMVAVGIWIAMLEVTNMIIQEKRLISRYLSYFAKQSAYLRWGIALGDKFESELTTLLHKIPMRGKDEAILAVSCKQTLAKYREILAI